MRGKAGAAGETRAEPALAAREESVMAATATIECPAFSGTAIEQGIVDIIERSVEELGRPDLYRKPLVAFSSARDERYRRLKDVIGDWVRTPIEFLPTAETVISYFVPYTRGVDAAPRNEELGSPVWGEAYVVINDDFNLVNDRICRYLEDAGFDAEPVPATHTYDEKDLKSAWSHRSAAAIAGLGYFSANRMLVTEKGSGGRYCTVFTSAPLETRRNAPENRCPYLKSGKCGKCFEACPAKALRPDGFDRFACLAVLKGNQDRIERGAGIEGCDVCGKCISVCPLAYAN